MDVMAADQRRTTFQVEMKVAVKLHRSDDVTAGAEVHRSSTLLDAGSDCVGDRLGVEGCAVALRSKGANVTHRERLCDQRCAEQQKEEWQKEFSQGTDLTELKRFRHDGDLRAQFVRVQRRP